MPSDIISDTSPAVIPGASLAVPGVSAIGPYERFYQLWPLVNHDSTDAVLTGAMPFTRILSQPHSNASVLVRLSIADFAAEAWAWYQVAP